MGAAGVWVQQESRNVEHKKRRTKETAGIGLQVVTALLACRIGYKLARVAVGKLFAEPKIIPVDDDSQQQEQDELQQLLTAEAAGVTARDQWVLSSDPAPEVPEGFKLVAQEHLPISVFHFYEQFLSIETTCLQDHHKSTGQYNFRASNWKADGDGQFTRLLDFMQPKKGMCSVNAHCLQEQRFSVHAGSVFVLRSDMHMEHIPYADCFRVQSFWRAEPDATGLGTNVAIHVAVPFSKRCLVKGIITGTTLSDCKGFYSDFLAKVQNSITVELLPTAAAAAAAAGQLLGDSTAHGLLSPRMGNTITSPFATAVDAEVFVRASSTGATTPVPSQQQQQQQVAHQRQHHHRRGSSASQQQQRHRQQQAPLLMLPSGLLLEASMAGSGLGALPSCRGLSSARQMARAVSAKPSFAQPIAELKLAHRGLPSREFITTAQAILVLLVLLVQLLTLYDNVLLRRLLATLPAAC